MVYSKKNVYAIGQSLRIVYDPNRPKKAVPQSGKWNEDNALFAFGIAWVLVLIFLIPGIVLTLIPIGNPICDDPTFQDMDFCTQQRP